MVDKPRTLKDHLDDIGNAKDRLETQNDRVREQKAALSGLAKSSKTKAEFKAYTIQKKELKSRISLRGVAVNSCSKAEALADHRYTLLDKMAKELKQLARTSTTFPPSRDGGGGAAANVGDGDDNMVDDISMLTVRAPSTVTPCAQQMYCVL